MRRLPRPELDFSEVYLACVNGSSNAVQTQMYTDALAEVCANANLYSEQGMQHSLFIFVASEWGHDEQISFGQLTKGGLNTLYSEGMVRSPQGRTYYDQLLATAPLGKCSYCQFGHAETLDHFLPKARYPSFAVVPDNLVPACMRCNKGKGSSIVTQENESSHPYFEDVRIENDVWLSAEVNQTHPVTSTFSVVCPQNWPDSLVRRVSNYFNDFDLAKRYSVEAASELVSISAYLSDLPSDVLRMEHLGRVAVQEKRLSPNSWKSALYSALASSVWYGHIGYTVGA